MEPASCTRRPSSTSAPRRRSRPSSATLFDRWLAAVRPLGARVVAPSASGCAGCLGRLGRSRGRRGDRASGEDRAEGAVAAPRGGGRGRRAEHERRDRGGDRRKAGADVPRGRRRPGVRRGRSTSPTCSSRTAASSSTRRRSTSTSRSSAPSCAATGTPSRSDCSSRRFVRPNGLERPVTPLLAEAILEAARVGVAPAGGTTATAGAGRPKGEPRILVFTPPGLTRFIPDVFLELLAADATLLFSGRRQKRPRIPAELKSRPQVEFVELPVEEPSRARAAARVPRRRPLPRPGAGGRLLAPPARDAAAAQARRTTRLEARSAGARAAPDPARDVRSDRRRARRPRAADPVRRPSSATRSRRWTSTSSSWSRAARFRVTRARSSRRRGPSASRR